MPTRRGSTPPRCAPRGANGPQAGHPDARDLDSAPAGVGRAAARSPSARRDPLRAFPPPAAGSAAGQAQEGRSSRTKASHCSRGPRSFGLA